MATTAEPRPVLSQGARVRAVQTFPDRSEFDLVVACCAESSRHDTSNTPRCDRIHEMLSRPLDWERVLAFVDHHRVVPHVYEALSAFSYLIPGRHLETLRSRYQDNARKALWFTAELVRIVSHLESAGIKALPYKGPVLAQTLYGEVTQRQFSDLDILILPADVLKAKAALRDLGYKPGIALAPYEESSHIETAYIETGYEHSLSAAQGANLLELQWRIVPRFYSIDFDVAGFLARADQIAVGGRVMPTLRAEDLLLVLCVHVAKHVWAQLSWLCDIAQLVNSRSLDWDAIQDDARRLGIERIVSLTLLLAHKLLGSALPRTISKQDNPSATALADEILPIIESIVPYDTESIAYFRLMMRLRERGRDRARFLWRLAFTPSVSEWSAIRLPKRLHPLYRLVRLSRLARRLASTA